jgi:purine-binding chemotaxis protein CheW
MGIAVDSIDEVVGITDEQITRLPYINARIRSEYIQGFTEQEGRIRILLDIDRVLTAKDLEMAESLAGTIAEEEAQHE